MFKTQHNDELGMIIFFSLSEFSWKLRQWEDADEDKATFFACRGFLKVKFFFFTF